MPLQDHRLLRRMVPVDGLEEAPQKLQIVRSQDDDSQALGGGPATAKHRTRENLGVSHQAAADTTGAVSDGRRSWTAEVEVIPDTAAGPDSVRILESSRSPKSFRRCLLQSPLESCRKALRATGRSVEFVLAQVQGPGFIISSVQGSLLPCYAGQMSK